MNNQSLNNSDTPSDNSNSTHENQTNETQTSAQQRPGFTQLLLGLVFNIAIPVMVLRKFSGEDSLGPTNALILALIFPLLAGLYEFIKDKKIGLMPAIGFISILLTGGIGVLQLPKEYIAIKEALVPLGFGLAVVVSIFTKKPVVRSFVYNDMFLKTDKINAKITETDQQQAFDRVMVNATWILAASFLVSSVLNYVLAKVIIVSETGTEAFNQEFSTMTLWSYPVIVVPSMIVTFYAMYFVFSRILKMTDFELEEIMRE